MVVVTLMVAVVVVCRRPVVEVADAFDAAEIVVITQAHFNASFWLCLMISLRHL